MKFIRVTEKLGGELTTQSWIDPDRIELMRPTALGTLIYFNSGRSVYTTESPLDILNLLLTAEDQPLLTQADLDAPGRGRHE